MNFHEKLFTPHIKPDWVTYSSTSATPLVGNIDEELCGSSNAEAAHNKAERKELSMWDFLKGDMLQDHQNPQRHPQIFALFAKIGVP